MSKLPRPPKYCRQRRKGRPDRAYVKIDGKRVYLGDYGTPESRRKYREAIAVMEESGKPETAKPAPTEPTLSVLLAGYLEFAVKKYGEKSIELWHLKAVAKLLRRTHGSTLARHFGPKAYQEARRAMIEEDWSRRYIGDQCSRIKRIVGWGVCEELLPGDAKHRLDAVRGLTAGEFGARETEPVKPVDQAAIDATLAELSDEVGDIVQLLLWTGMRPGELVQLSADHIDRSGDVWVYRPPSHKTIKKGKRREVAIGPKAQAVLAKYLFRERCFTHKVASIRQAVKRAAKRAGVAEWFPYQLRHNAGTNARAVAGLEGAQALLGHARADVTQVYAESVAGRAAEVARAIG